MRNCEVRSVLPSKVTTLVQFLILMSLCLGYVVPGYVFFVFIVLGLMTLRDSSPHFMKCEV